tara:strand:- start:1146 stop:1376 length:231 start_codon:yes stop_codon:yes gene_type:complete
MAAQGWELALDAICIDGSFAQKAGFAKLRMGWVQQIATLKDIFKVLLLSICKSTFSPVGYRSPSESHEPLRLRYRI